MKDRTFVPQDWSHAGLGEAFGQKIKGSFLYCKRFGGWMQWDGRRWTLDQTDAVFDTFRTYIHDLQSHYWRNLENFRESPEYQKLKEDERPKAEEAYLQQIDNARKYLFVGNMEAAVKVARRLQFLVTLPEQFDTQKHYLNVANGTINLRSGMLMRHSRLHMLTKIADVEYDPDATHSDLDKALRATSPEVAEWLKVFYGYCATGETNKDAMPVFDGTGANGKTTILLAVGKALGDYAGAAHPSLLMRSAHEQHPTIFADLRGKRMVYIEETAEGGKLAVETMKALTGGSKIKGRFMRENFIEFDSTHKLIVATNHRPITNTGDFAVWRRLKLVPFPKRFTGDDDLNRLPTDLLKDPHLRDNLKNGRKQQQAVLRMVVDGAYEYYQDNWPLCREIDEATDEWRKREDVIYRFLHENDDVGFNSDASIPASTLFELYKDWCEIEGRPPGTNKTFAQRLETHDEYIQHRINKKRSTRGQTYYGIGSVKKWPVSQLKSRAGEN